MTEIDPGALGEKIAMLEMEFAKLANHPDRDIRKRALLCLERVEVMKQEIQDAIQHFADAQARGNLD